MRRDQLLKEKQFEAVKYLDCSTCMASPRMTSAARAQWRCGWMKPTEIAARSVRNDPPDWGVSREDLCPIYYISLPQVREAGEAHTCWKEGQLADAYPDCDRSKGTLLLETVLELNGYLGEAEAEALRKIDG